MPQDIEPKSSGTSLPLGGRVIALPENRELDRLAELLEKEGARIWRCPLITIIDAPDQRPVEAWVAELASGVFDDLVFMTGEGLRRLIAVADRLGLRQAVLAALARARKITRGPKPARALKELGLAVDIPAAEPTTRGITAVLATLDLQGHRVGVQLYGDQPNLELVAMIEAAGAIAHAVSPYVYAPASDDGQVGELIDAMAEGRIDAIAFTSAGQVDRLFDVARRTGRDARLSAAWSKTRAAAIGPVVKDALVAKGISPDIVPEKAFVMKRLVGALAEALRR